MFTDKSFEVVSFTSETSEKKSETVANVQTTDVVYTHAETQAVEKRTVETQTAVENKTTPQVDYQKLAQFLTRVAPSVLEALDETHGTDAFENYNPKTDETVSLQVQLLKKFNTAKESSQQVKVSGLTWSVSGGTVAVSHSILYHEAWCDHLTNVQLYNLSQIEKFSSLPQKTLELNSCVTSLSYHPTEPSIIAAGLFNGDVLVWNLSDDNCVTPLQVCTHTDSVSQIQWKPKLGSNVSLLVSSSSDGYVFVHKFIGDFTHTDVHKRFKVIKEHNPVENSRPRSAGGSRERAAEAGLCITSFDFSWQDPAIFIVGTLCGGIYKCSLDNAVNIEGDPTLFDPVVDEYERHEGSVTCVKCSPIRNLFVTTSTDKEIYVFSFNEQVNQRSISIEDTAIGLTWMIGNQDVFAAYGAGSTVRFYDVRDGKAISNVDLQADERENTTCFSLHSKRDLAAIGDADGNVEIWKIPRQCF